METKIEYGFTPDETICAIEELLKEHDLKIERSWDADRLYLKVVKV